jgi:pyruvate/2-oxoacid:ferredoxin oxidoreductase beta subunit/Pyruvate/2-oxoacid:ferredoxin oxidoreductase gamma subunit
MVDATATRHDSYRSGASYPFCPGCGHGGLLDQLNRALVTLQVDPRRTVIVSDIGCSGLSDQYFHTHAFHGLHGRSLTYATGIKLARPDLRVIVIMGDGGCGIGGAHLLSAARRNIGLTVLVFNNFNFGMTGGQHSVTTPPGRYTATTPGGNLERPLDVCATVAANGAAYVYRGTAFDADLHERLAEGLSVDGFALFDLWELCTAYFAPQNAFSKLELMATLGGLRFATGVLHRDARPEYARALRAAGGGRELSAPRWLAPRHAPGLSGRFGLVLAGAAGGKVRSAARLAGLAAILSGLRVTQRDDYPVTVKSGPSISELVFDRGPIESTMLARPDALVVAAAEGLPKVARYLARMGPSECVFVTPEFAALETRARVVVVDLDAAGARLARPQRALALLASALGKLGVVPREALREAATLHAPAYAEANLKAIDAGWRAA